MPKDDFDPESLMPGDASLTPDEATQPVTRGDIGLTNRALSTLIKMVKPLATSSHRHYWALWIGGIGLALDLILSVAVIHNTIGTRSGCQAGNAVRADIVRLIEGITTQPLPPNLTPAEVARERQAQAAFVATTKKDLAPRHCSFWSSV